MLPRPPASPPTASTSRTILHLLALLPTRAALLTGIYPHQAGIGHIVETSGNPSPIMVTPATRARSATASSSSPKFFAPSAMHRPLRQMASHAVYRGKSALPLQRAGVEEFFGTIHGAGSFYDPSRSSVSTSSVPSSIPTPTSHPVSNSPRSNSPTTASCVVVRETSAGLHLASAEKNAAVTTLAKSTIRDHATTPPMPPLLALMTPRELRDLVEFLASQ